MSFFRNALLYPFDKCAAKPWAQPWAERLHALALRAMNCGGGAHLSESGERWVMRRLAQRIPTQQPVVLFDVGANRGDFSLALLDAFGRHSAVELYAFEPSAVLQPALNAALGTHADRAKIITLGISDGAGSQPLFRPSNPNGSGCQSLYQRRLEHFGETMRPGETVALETLDRFCERERIDRIDFLKLDIEGHELAALRGASSLLRAGKIDWIQFEFGGCNIDSRTYFQDFFYMLRERYDLYRIIREGLYPIKSYRERHEIFLTTNFLAMRR